MSGSLSSAVARLRDLKNNCRLLGRVFLLLLLPLLVEIFMLELTHGVPFLTRPLIRDPLDDGGVGVHAAPLPPVQCPVIGNHGFSLLLFRCLLVQPKSALGSIEACSCLIVEEGLKEVLTYVNLVSLACHMAFYMFTSALDHSPGSKAVAYSPAKLQVLPHETMTEAPHLLKAS